MLTKVCIVKAMVFLVVMHGFESWTIKQGERGELMLSNWCWSRLLRGPWTARGSNQSILKEINPEYSLEKTLMLGKIEGKRRRGWQRMRWLYGITDSVDMSLSIFRETVKDSKVWRAAVHGVAKSWTQLSDWTITTKKSGWNNFYNNIISQNGL